MFGKTIDVVAVEVADPRADRLESAGKMTTSVLSKFMPGMGSAIGTVSLATFGASATYAIGKVFVRHFENGGSFATFSAKDIQEDLKKEFATASKS